MNQPCTTLKHWGAFCITPAEVWGQRTAKPEIIPSPYSAFMYRETPWCVPIYLFSPQLVLRLCYLKRDIKCSRLLPCVDNKLFHSSSQTRSHLSSLFTENQEMKNNLFPETLFSEIWKKISSHSLWHNTGNRHRRADSCQQHSRVFRSLKILSIEYKNSWSPCIRNETRKAQHG